MTRIGRLCALLLAASLLGAVQPVAAGQAPYGAWVACSLSKQAPSSHSCKKGSDKAAFFKSRAASVEYKICVRYPTGTRLCASHQSAPKGAIVSNRITSSIVGEHRVTWSVAGHQVKAWTFQVKA
jgi:hypothetical protein